MIYANTLGAERPMLLLPSRLRRTSWVAPTRLLVVSWARLLLAPLLWSCEQRQEG